MAYADVLVHTAQQIAQEGPAAGARVEGEYDVTEVRGTPFPCCLFLPLPSEADRHGRTAIEPTVLLPGASAVQRSERLLITAPEVTGPAPVEWQVLGVQPFGKPGRPLIGHQATLRRIEDG